MKDNKLIAEFMKLPTEVFKSGIMNYHHDGAWYEEHELSYEKSWDWLMPVVQECRLESRCEYDTDDAWDKIHWALEECNIEEIYKAVVEFIKQLNK
mgnify:CR=1 FL=1